MQLAIKYYERYRFWRTKKCCITLTIISSGRKCCPIHFCVDTFHMVTFQHACKHIKNIYTTLNSHPHNIRSALAKAQVAAYRKRWGNIFEALHYTRKVTMRKLYQAAVTACILDIIWFWNMNIRTTENSGFNGLWATPQISIHDETIGETSGAENTNVWAKACLLRGADSEYRRKDRYNSTLQLPILVLHGGHSEYRLSSSNLWYFICITSRPL